MTVHWEESGVQWTCLLCSKLSSRKYVRYNCTVARQGCELWFSRCVGDTLSGSVCDAVLLFVLTPNCRWPFVPRHVRRLHCALLGDVDGCRDHIQDDGEDAGEEGLLAHE